MKTQASPGPAPSSSQMRAATAQDTRSGMFMALTTYALWGILPLYLKLVSDMPMLEVLVHRAIWALPVTLIVLIAMKNTAELAAALRSPKMIFMATCTAIFISCNWGIYVWAISIDRVGDAALGYYINPLFSVLIAALVLKEKLSKMQWCAIAIMAVAVGLLTYESGSLPLISIGLATTWGIYATLKRMLPLPPTQGFALEVLVLLPFALGLWIYLASTTQTHFLTGSVKDTLLLMGLGVMTAVPLILYANAAKRVRLSTISLLQYSTPSVLFLLAIFVFKEDFSTIKLITFVLIWIAIAVYTVPLIRELRKKAP